VQLERGAVGGLARTGFSLLPLAGLGTLLSLIGVALMSAKRKSTEDTEVVVVAERLEGN
jgi:hypothetical protein